MLHDAIERDEVLKAARAKLIFRQWGEVVGPELAKRCAPDRYDRGTLWVAAEGSAWAQEIRLIKPLLLSRMNDLAHEGLFQDVRVGVRSFQRIAATAQDQAVVVIPDSEELTIQQIAAKRLGNWPREGSV
jgi:predicted nucleic acid-binding Zn ribbon protein